MKIKIKYSMMQTDDPLPEHVADAIAIEYGKVLAQTAPSHRAHELAESVRVFRTSAIRPKPAVWKFKLLEFLNAIGIYRPRPMPTQHDDMIDAVRIDPGFFKP